MDYLFLLPITVLTWKKIQVESLVFLAGEYEDYIRYPDKRYIVETLAQIGVNRLIFRANLTFVGTYNLCRFEKAFLDNYSSSKHMAGVLFSRLLDYTPQASQSRTYSIPISPYLSPLMRTCLLLTYPLICRIFRKAKI